jgi:hypothetical protein
VAGCCTHGSEPSIPWREFLTEEMLSCQGCSLLVSPIHTAFTKWQFHKCRSRHTSYSTCYLHQQGWTFLLCPHVIKHSLLWFQACHCLVYVNMVSLFHKAGDCWWSCVFNATCSNPHNLLLLDWVCARFWLFRVKCIELDITLGWIKNSFLTILMGVTNFMTWKHGTLSISHWGILFPRKFLPPD